MPGGEADRVPPVGMKRPTGEVSAGELEGLNRVPRTEAFDTLEQPGGREVLFGLFGRGSHLEGSEDGLDTSRPGGGATGPVAAHLSTLSEAGYIDLNPETGRIRKGRKFSQIEPLLTLLVEHRDELPDSWQVGGQK